MKIVIFGNTNNYPLIMAHALRRMGVDVELVVNRKDVLHRPENSDTAYAGGYPDWIHDFCHLKDEAYLSGEADFRRLFADADGVLLNHLGPALQGLFDGPAISFLTGSDLDYYANYDTVKAVTAAWSDAYKKTPIALKEWERWARLIKAQRSGIRNSTGVSFFPRGLIPESDRLLDEIGVSDRQRFHIYMGDVDAIEHRAGRESTDTIRIFCGARLTWKKPIPDGASKLDYKGTDILLYGFKALLARTPAKLELRLVKKGLHIQETMALASSLGLDSYVSWLPEMPRYQFLKELVEADICVDNLGESVIGMAGLDAMATGRPLVANARPEVYGRLLEDESPVCHARTADEVALQLERLIEDVQGRLQVGRKSREFVERYWSPAANALICLQRLGLVEANVKTKS